MLVPCNNKSNLERLEYHLFSLGTFGKLEARSQVVSRTPDLRSSLTAGLTKYKPLQQPCQGTFPGIFPGIGSYEVGLREYVVSRLLQGLGPIFESILLMPFQPDLYPYRWHAELQAGEDAGLSWPLRSFVKIDFMTIVLRHVYCTSYGPVELNILSVSDHERIGSSGSR